MATYIARIGNFTTKRAKELGGEAGIAAAARHKRDPEWFEDTPNPFGIDSEDDLHEVGRMLTKMYSRRTNKMRPL